MNQPSRKECPTAKVSTGALFNRYVWLVDTIYRAGRITFEQINERWLCSSFNDLHEDLPLKTFHNHKNAIQQMFDINICCDRCSGYVYYIENVDDMEQGGIRSWLLNTFAVNNLIHESHHLKRRILFERIPSGQRFLIPIIEAMRDNRTIIISYKGFWRDSPHTCVVAPYCIKVFRQRWYVVARSISDEKLRVYALDRIRELQTTENKFEFPIDFDPAAYFEDAFGIVVNEEYDVEHVRIRVTDNQQNYLRSLPLHSSQIETDVTTNYSIFEYRLCATDDFQRELMSFGAAIEVLSPQWLREEFCRNAVRIHGLYQTIMMP